MNPAESSLDKTIEGFFNKLAIQHQYYSIQSKQPVLLIGEKDLYEAIKKLLAEAEEKSILKIKEKDFLKEIKSAVS